MVDDVKTAKKLVKEFHKVWEECGKPHPNSNDYINLNRVFFYAKGVESGIETATQLSKENK